MSIRQSLAGAVRATPVLGPAVTWLRRQMLARQFHGSSDYWEARYRDGKNSGSGSYGRLALFKADFLNAFVRERGIASVLEFGCGDGAQLKLAAYPVYVGLDVSPTVIQRCEQIFAGDPTKSFFLYHPLAFCDRDRRIHADLVLSLDVIYHLIEDDIFAATMRHMFAAADRYVIIYSADRDERTQFQHVRLRAFTPWVEANCPSWRLAERVPNRYPYDRADPNNTSISDFVVFERSN